MKMLLAAIDGAIFALPYWALSALTLALIAGTR